MEPELKSIIKSAIKTAKQLGYSEDVIKKIKKAHSEREITKILTTARTHEDKIEHVDKREKLIIS